MNLQIATRVLACAFIALTIVEIQQLRATVARLVARLDGLDERADAIEIRANELKAAQESGVDAIQAAMSFSIQAFCSYRPTVCDRLKIDYVKEPK